MRGEVLPVVAARIEMEFVRNFSRSEHTVQSRCAGFKTEIILISTIEINFHASELCRARDGKGRIAFPERGIGRTAECATENSGTRRILCDATQIGREFFDQCRTVRADGGKKFGMTKRKVQRAVAAHGSSGDGSICAARPNSKAFLDGGQKFLHKKIFVADFPIVRIDVEGCSRGRGDD